MLGIAEALASRLQLTDRVEWGAMTANPSGRTTIFSNDR
jgi:hypothetical protein